MQKILKSIRRGMIYLSAFVILTACASTAASQGISERTSTSAHGSIDYSDVTFTPWDVKAASAKISKRAPKPYTIMVYMNGSDLESENGAATYDLIEMLESGLDAKNANLLIFTGGTLRWQNDLIPANNCMVWEIADGEISSLAGVGLMNMGNSGTLSSFIEFGMENFPADKYGLIMWDHGGGSIAGYGHDERFNNSTLTLLDMGYAFEKSGLSEKKLEFLGFDSCLMATVEMAIVASDYAKYLVASEDLSPGDGWDYGFLEVLNDNPAIDGAALGIKIVDYFMDYYGANSEDILNTSVIDLSNIDRVMTSMGQLMSLCNESLLEDRAASFRALAKRRNGTRTFGLGSPRDNESDMVDIGDMAYRLSDLYPSETEAIFTALDDAVIYNRNNSGAYLSGVSTYYVYGGRDTGRESLNVYTALNMDEDYTGYLHRFYGLLTGSTNRTRSAGRTSEPDEIVRTELTAWRTADDKPGYYIMTGINSPDDDALWPVIDGMYVCMYRINESKGNVLYAVPAELNGRKCDIIVLMNESNPDGKVLGARNEDGYIIQKGYDDIKSGDLLAFYYPLRNFDTAESSWSKSEVFTVSDNLQIEWAHNDDARYSLRRTDIHNNEYYSDLY